MITAIITAVTFLSTFFAVFHLVCSFKYKREPVMNVKNQLGFSLIIPCYNEERILPSTVAGLLNLEYGNFEVIFVNDGSTDQTGKVLNDMLDITPYYGDRIVTDGLVYQSKKYPNFFVIEKSNSGKAASLNKGIQASSKELIVTMDCDCILERDALKVMNQTFQDQEVIAAGGVVHVMQYFLLNRKRKSIIDMQTLDYFKGFYIYKSSLAYNGALNIISGAFGVFRKDALLAVGGFRDGLGEDIDITIRLQEYALRQNKVITYNLGAVCYTECPETWRDLCKQRVRWQKAFLDAIIKNWRFLLRNLVKSNMCFLMIVDAAFSGTIAVISFLFNFLLIVLRSYYGYPLFFIIVTLFAVIFNVVSALVAIRRAREHQLWLTRQQRQKTDISVRSLLASIVIDIVCFSFLRIYYFVKGSISFALNQKSWDKVERTTNYYKV